MSNSTRLAEALSLLTQSPPGQTSQVYHDLRGILFDSEANVTDKIDDANLQSAAAIALEEYNTSQLVTATIEDVPVIICQAGQVPSASSSGAKTYIHPKLKKTFAYDHVKRTVSDVKEAKEAHPEVEKVRAALEKALEEYVKDRYPDGVSSVFAVSSVPAKDESELAEDLEKAKAEDAKTPADSTAATAASGDADRETQDAQDKSEEKEEEEMKDDPVDAVETAEAVTTSESSEPSTTLPSPKTTFTFHHVGNRFNLSNFWSGRWRASYTLDPSTSSLTSSLSVQVHYFENGNVQLNAAKPRTFQLGSSSGEADTESMVKQVVKVVSAHEDGWQLALEQSYDQLAEKAFKALRRQLPLTRQKVDWDKVLNYKLGDELSRAS